MAKSETKMSLKLVVDKSNYKVLFAEAGKEFVDFILHLLSLPLATVVKLLAPENMMGCLGDLFKSVESLNPKYFQSEHGKDSLLNPKIGANIPLFSLTSAPTTVTNIPRKIYKCRVCGSFASDLEGIMCPGCRSDIVSEMQYISPMSCTCGKEIPPSDDSGGSVKEFVTYMVMDNLQVKPILATIFRINDNASIVDLDVQVGLKEGLAILKASLQTEEVLSSVFFDKIDELND